MSYVLKDQFSSCPYIRDRQGRVDKVEWAKRFKTVNEALAFVPEVMKSTNVIVYYPIEVVNVFIPYPEPEIGPVIMRIDKPQATTAVVEGESPRCNDFCPACNCAVEGRG